MTAFENNYNLAKIKIDTDTNTDGDDVPRPEFINEPGKTLAVHYINSFLYRFTSEIIRRKNIKKICILSESHVGFFNCFSGDIVDNYIGFYFNPDDYNLKRIPEQNTCFLCDFTGNESIISQDYSYQNLLKCVNENDVLLSIGSLKGFSSGFNNCREIFSNNGLSVEMIIELSGPNMIAESFHSFDELDSLREYLYLTVARKGSAGSEYVKEVNVYYENLDFFDNLEEGCAGDEISSGAILPPLAYMGRRNWYAIKKVENYNAIFDCFNKIQLKEIIDFVSIDGKRLSQTEIDSINIDIRGKISLVGKESVHLTGYIEFKSLLNKNSLFESRLQNVSLQLNLDKINPDFLLEYIYSEVGRNTLNSMFSSDYVLLSKFLDYFVLLPDRIDQDLILKSHSQFQSLTSKMRREYYEISFDAFIDKKSRSEIERKLVSVQSAIGMLGDLSRVKNAIAAGESLRLEFKQTFSSDIKTGEKAKYIEDSAIKTIAGFLNSDGGNLICGVSDRGELIGLSAEIDKFFKSSDSYLLHVKNLIKQRIGAEYYPFISFKLLEVDGVLVLEFVCSPSNSPVFVDDKDFYVRTNPATDRLEGRKLHEYISHRFN